jgi:acyl-CoA synthetase (AMP-forming)/AMP-acid ligase II
VSSSAIPQSPRPRSWGCPTRTGASASSPYVVARPGAEVDTEALDSRCLDEIARYKRPREYRVVEELPRNSAGKVLKASSGA